MSLDPRLLEILACPQDKGPLYYLDDENALHNPRLKLRYEVRDGIPIMLVDEAVTVASDEHDRIMRKIEADNLAPTGPRSLVLCGRHVRAHWTEPRRVRPITDRAVSPRGAAAAHGACCRAFGGFGGMAAGVPGADDPRGHGTHGRSPTTRDRWRVAGNSVRGNRPARGHW